MTLKYVEEIKRAADKDGDLTVHVNRPLVFSRAQLILRM